MKLELLGLIDHALAEGWTHLRACRVLRLDDRRARRWQQRRSEGLPLEDETGGGQPVHGLMPHGIQAIAPVGSLARPVVRALRVLGLMRGRQLVMM